MSQLRPNGCELPALGPQAQVSGRGSLPQFLSQLAELVRFIASDEASPVRSSELLGRISSLYAVLPSVIYDSLSSIMIDDHHG
jgi:hypothetical protein